MGDDRFTWLHTRDETVEHLLNRSFDDRLPEEAGAIPPFQDEVDDSALPIDTHPSYPFGNPYRSTAGSRLALPFPHSHARSLASTLPSVYLARLGGAQPSSGWNDLGLDELLPYEEPPEPPGMLGGVNEHSGAAADDDEQGMPGVDQAATTADGSGGEEDDEDLSDEEAEQNGDTPEVYRHSIDASSRRRRLTKTREAIWHPLASEH